MASGRECILVMTTDDTLGVMLSRLLEQNGYEVTVARDLSRAIEAGRRAVPTLILTERRSGFQRLRREPALRAVPIVALEQPGLQCKEEECLQDLDQGADASLCGVSYRETLARIRAILRREELRTAVAERYDVGTLHLDTVRHEVLVKGRPVELTPKEFQILLHFMKQPARVFSRDELLNLVWGEGYALEQHTLDVHIHSLRHKIEPDASRPTYIVTVRGVGYKLAGK
jgi:DNA-binding response OmpR family regulator